MVRVCEGISLKLTITVLSSVASNTLHADLLHCFDLLITLEMLQGNEISDCQEDWHLFIIWLCTDGAVVRHFKVVRHYVQKRNPRKSDS